MLKLIQLLSGVFDKVLDNVLFAQPIAAGDGILKVLLQRQYVSASGKPWK